MLVITVTDSFTGRSETAHIPGEFASSFRSLIGERRNELGSKMAGAHKYEQEDAQTRAMAAMGAFASALNAVVATEDPHYA